MGFRGRYVCKYNNEKVSHAGRSFASKLEAALYDRLFFMEKAGEIAEIQQQKHIRLTKAELVFIVDFQALDLKSNTIHYFEAKGLETQRWLVVKKLWPFYGPGPLHIYSGHYKSLIGPKTILPEVTCEP